MSVDGLCPAVYSTRLKISSEGSKTVMANTTSAQKMVRKIASRTAVNKSRRSRVRTYVRKLEAAVQAGDAGAAQAAFKTVESEMMRAVSKGVIHKNTAARKVSRLSKQVRTLSA